MIKRRGEITLSSTKVRIGNKVENQVFCLLCKIPNEKFFIDASSLRPDPIELLNAKKTYKATLYLSPVYIENNNPVELLKKIEIDSEKLLFVNIR